MGLASSLKQSPSVLYVTCRGRANFIICYSSFKQPLYLNIEGVEHKGLSSGPFLTISFLFFTIVVLTWGWHWNHLGPFTNHRCSSSVGLRLERIGKPGPFSFLERMVRTLTCPAIGHNLKILCILLSCKSD